MKSTRLICVQVLCLAWLLTAVCETRAQTGAAPPTGLDMAKLLTKEEVGTVQGCAMTEAKSSVGKSGSLRISQCFYASSEPNKSVSLAVAQADPDATAKRTVKEFWHETFDRYAATGPTEKEADAAKKPRDADESPARKKDADEEKEHAENRKPAGSAARRPHAGEEENENERNPPQPVAGLGDGAYWSGNPVGGVLYVLKGEKFIRVSVGGPDNQEVKLNKSKAIAGKVLPRL